LVLSASLLALEHPILGNVGYEFDPSKNLSEQVDQALENVIYADKQRLEVSICNMYADLMNTKEQFQLVCASIEHAAELEFTPDDDVEPEDEATHQRLEYESMHEFKEDESMHDAETVDYDASSDNGEHDDTDGWTDDDMCKENGG
jgi:hypothetical protein